MKALKPLLLCSLLLLGSALSTLIAQVSTDFVRVPAPMLRTNFVYDGPACDGDYIPVFRDDFSGNALDEGNWTIHEGPNTTCFEDEKHGAYSRSQVNVAGGNLELSVERRDQPILSFCTNKEGETETRFLWYDQAQISSNNSAGKNPGGCWKYGKYCIRTKVADPCDDIRSAFWFFGWAGEPDVFEFLDNSNKGKKRPKSNFHMMDALYRCSDPNGFNGRVYHDGWAIDYCCEPKEDPNSTCNDCPLSAGVDKEEDCVLLSDIERSETHENGTDYSAGFHEFCFEWTPFKMVWSIDGEEVRKIYRFYTNFVESLITGVHGNPIECLEVGDEFDNIVENMWFPRAGQNLDMLLSLIPDNGGINGDGPYKMLVDYVKVEQMNVPKAELIIDGTVETLCLGDEMTIKLETEDQIDGLEWDIPDNFAVVTVNPADNSIVITPIANPDLSSGKAEVITASYANPTSCHDITRTIEVWIGAPEHPEILIDMLGCTGLVHFYLPGQINGQIDWTVSGPAGVLLHQSTTPQNGILVELGDLKPQLLYYEVTIENECGEVTISGHYLTEDCSGHDVFRSIKITPNPTFGPTVDVELENFEPTLFESQGLELSVVDEYLNAQQSHTAFSNFETLDVSQLPNGYYYLYTQLEGEAIYSSKFLVMQ